MQENPRQALFGKLKELSKEARREELNKAKRDPSYWSSRNEEIEKRQGEISINEGLGVYIKNKTLYHGSPIGGIQVFHGAEDKTIGSGVYLTSKARDGINYAKVRTGKENPRHILYEVSISDMKFLDLRNTPNVRQILPGFKQKLIELKAKNTPSSDSTTLDKTIQSMLDHRIQLIQENKIDDTNIREATKSVGDAFSDYVQSMGYDGVLAYEGGEGKDIFTEDHDSYVVFDPNRIHIIQEQEIAA